MIDDSNTASSFLILKDHVEKIVMESGNIEGFDSRVWLENWIETPLPALNNQKPKMFMNNKEDLEILLNILSRMQSGAYS